MEIGKPQRTFVVEPETFPAPKDVPVPKENPPVPVPVPDKELVPA